MCCFYNDVDSSSPGATGISPRYPVDCAVSHDPDFVSRDGLIVQIHEKASITGSRVVLVGLGGVGKTQLIHASNAARCEKSLRDLADRTKIPGRQDYSANILQAMEISKTKLGEDHPSTLTSMANLASTYWKQGRLKQAEKVFVQVMEICKTKLGEDTPQHADDHGQSWFYLEVFRQSYGCH
ncbi:uncharacterized protein N7458_005927 [Penicillium daleae]|uniref:Kinesin light chain n=1 Tax=Penicillium daleae TaxID=63821 RepID=A0AAD6C3F2_9EURO|nr:uncharacterized protein N7458_005927 [Penicillium daleae]KAJ5449478.1 hypothetical protein N7458_005927 [Penicillium daleae]